MQLPEDLLYPITKELEEHALQLDIALEGHMETVILLNLEQVQEDQYTIIQVDQVNIAAKEEQITLIAKVITDQPEVVILVEVQLLVITEQGALLDLIIIVHPHEATTEVLITDQVIQIQIEVLLDLLINQEHAQIIDLELQAQQDHLTDQEAHQQDHLLIDREILQEEVHTIALQEHEALELNQVLLQVEVEDLEEEDAKFKFNL